MKIFKGIIEIHDFVFFASRDLAKIVTTEKVIHNTALNYAVNYISRIINISSKPSYQDIENFNIRVTPAHPLGVIPEISFSYNTVNDKDVSTDSNGNFPTAGKYYKINLGITRMLREKKDFKFTAFEFFVFSFNDLSPRRIIRLGKKDNYCIVTYDELQQIKLREVKKGSPIEPSHVVNPLELEGKLAEGFPVSWISIPPYLLIRNCRISEGKYIEALDNKNKYKLFPPKDKIEDIMSFYGNDRNQWL